MILKGALAGYRMVEVPVSYYPRIGKSKISGTLKGTVGAGWFILSLIVRYYFRRRRTGHHGRHIEKGWPIQARFWLEWGCSDLSNSVIPTGTDHRESGGVRSGGTLCSDVGAKTAREDRVDDVTKTRQKGSV